MLRLLRSESYKLLRTGVVWALPAAPLAGLLSGVTQLNIEADINQWYLPLLVMNMIYALLFLPLITGVFASMVCRYEHQAGGWKAAAGPARDAGAGLCGEVYHGASLDRAHAAHLSGDDLHRWAYTGIHRSIPRWTSF